MEIIRELGRIAVSSAFVVAAVLAGSGKASADGMPAKAASVFQTATNWSGFYLGVHSGEEWSSFDASVGSTTAFSVDQNSQVAGVQLGVQHQFGNLVLGVEGSLTSAFRNSYGATACPNTSFTCAATFDDVWTIGPRVGWAMGKWMPYITGGYANGAFTEKIFNAAAVTNQYTDHQRHSGWYIGGGVDMALAAGWTMGLDYRHYDFDDETYNVTRTTAGGVIDTSQPANVGNGTAEIVTIRVSWKFGRPEPVAAAPLK